MPITSNEDICVSDLLAEQKRRIKGLEIQTVKINKNLAKLKLQIKNSSRQCFADLRSFQDLDRFRSISIDLDQFRSQIYMRIEIGS